MRRKPLFETSNRYTKIALAKNRGTTPTRLIQPWKNLQVKGHQNSEGVKSNRKSNHSDHHTKKEGYKIRNSGKFPHTKWEGGGIWRQKQENNTTLQIKYSPNNVFKIDRHQKKANTSSGNTNKEVLFMDPKPRKIDIYGGNWKTTSQG